MLKRTVQKGTRQGEDSIPFNVLPAGAYLGCVLEETTTQLADQYGVKGKRGALVTKVVPNSPANTAGFKAGDVIRKIGEVEIRGARDFFDTMSKSQAGTEVNILVLRENEEMTLAATLGPEPEQACSG